MMVFRAKGAKTFKLRVVAPSGAQAILSTSCQVHGDAKDVERIVKQWQGKSPLGRAGERPAVLELLVAKTVTLREAYELELAGALDAWMTARDRAAAAAESEPDVDLHPLVTAWHARKVKAKKGSGMAGIYLTQLRTLFPLSQPFTLSMWTRKELKARLEALDVGEPTRNRYRAALSSFADKLLDEELVEVNVTRTIRSYEESDEREVWYHMDDAERLIAALPQPYAGLAALMAGFCMEVSATQRLRVADVALDAEPVTARARGTKRAWRDRVVPLVSELEWTLPFIRAALADRLPDARPFDIPEWRSIRVIRKVARELAITAINQDEQGEHSLHDWRHSHSVWLAQFGYTPAIGAAHLGHKNTDQFNKRYGKHAPNAHDYALAKERQQQRAATKLATSARTTKQGKGRKNA